MKQKIFLTIILICTFSFTKAQQYSLDSSNIPYDSMFANLNSTKITTGVLIEKTINWGNTSKYNGSNDSNT